MQLLLLSFLMLPACLFAKGLQKNLGDKGYHNERLSKDQSLESRAKPYLIRDNHRIKPILDRIFSKRVTENREAFDAAGFEIVSARPVSYIIVARHPDLPGYLFKVYLDSETRLKDDIPGEEWLIQRCIGAEYIRDLIKKKKIKNFVVPSKRLYALPKYPRSKEAYQQPYVLIVKDMGLVSTKESIEAWKTKATSEVLRELYCFLSRGYGSPTFIVNIPYTKTGKFAFIDTEYPKREFNLHNPKKYFSPEMCIYWDTLLQEHGKL